MFAALRTTAVAGSVARGVEGALGADELWQNAAMIAAQLPPPSPGSMVTFAFGKDRAAFAAALLGTWWAGHGAALPENDRREYVVPVLGRPESVAFLHDTGVGRGIDVSRLLAEGRDTTAAPASPVEDPERVVLETHTVASDGQVQIERWTAAELLAAVDAVVSSLQLQPGAVVAHGFTPAFLPAVLVGFLAPLRVGGSFLLGAPSTVEQLAAAARSTDASVLLCSSRQLREVAALPSGALQSVAALACFGPLPARAVAKLRTHHDLTVEAILAAPADPAADCVDLLLEIDGVEDAEVARLPGAALVAIVGPDTALLSARSAAASVFAEDVDLVVRAVPALPRGPNDRIPYGDLCVLFGLGRDGRPVTRDLEWRTDPPAEDGTQRFRTRVPERFAFFEGHFTTYPVLAGGAQLHELVLPCIRNAEPGLGALQRLEAIKFLARIAPADEITVTIRVLDDGHRVQFEVWCGDTRCTAGKLSFAPWDAAETDSE